MAKKPTLDEMRLALTRGKTKHEHAHEKARLNAIKMLGLHEKNTAQDRAKAMGFDLETFHGTDAPDIESLDPERTKIIKGVFSTTNPKTASRYAEDERKRAKEKTAPNVLPLLIKSASHETIPKYDINTINAYKNRGAKGVYRPEMQTAVTFDPSHIRSRFAAFDPEREHDTDLLAAKGGNILPHHQREANKAKFLEPSKVKERLYHGTNKDIKSFKVPKNAIGIWATKNPDVANEYATISARGMGEPPSVYPVHVRLKNPANKDQFGDAWDLAAEDSSKLGWNTHNERHKKILQDQGFDGAILDDSVVVFDPKHVKSATGNRGTFNPNIADITKAKGGEVKYPSIEEMIQKLREAGRTPVMPAPDRWFKHPEKHPFQQKAIEKLLAHTGHAREDFPFGAHINPITGEPLDFEIMNDLGVVIDPNTGNPMMSGIKSELTEIDPKLGSLTKSNLIRKSLFKHEGGDPLLDRIKFLATIEKSGKGHHYGLSTQYASPAELVQEMTGNPTLRPHSRGDIYGVGDEIGRISIKGMHHPVYEKLLVAPSGSDVQGKKLHKAKGGGIPPHIKASMDQMKAELQAKVAQDKAYHHAIRKMPFDQIPTFEQWKQSQPTHAHHLEIEERPL
jgi:ADP-Ribosyltransferase in polyvalent proteins